MLLINKLKTKLSVSVYIVYAVSILIDITFYYPEKVCHLKCNVLNQLMHIL